MNDQPGDPRIWTPTRESPIGADVDAVVRSYALYLEVVRSDMLKSFTRDCRALRRSGSAALDLAYVAAGRADGYWEIGLNSWDIAAGVLLVREAGGFVGDLNGGDKFFSTGNIVAANPRVFKTMVQHIRPHLTPELKS